MAPGAAIPELAVHFRAAGGCAHQACEFFRCPEIGHKVVVRKNLVRNERPSKPIADVLRRPYQESILPRFGSP